MTVDGQRLARDDVAVRARPRPRCSAGTSSVEPDPVADLQAGGLARVLDGAHDVARVALGAQRVVERGVEHDEPAAGQHRRDLVRSAPSSADDGRQLVLGRLERHVAVVGA